MDTLKAVSRLSDDSQYDRCFCRDKNREYPFIYEAKTPRGKCSLMKTLVSNHCSGDCRYCVNNAARSHERQRLDPLKLADMFFHVKKRNLIDGAFLSSGIDKNADFSMHRIVRTAEIIRKRGFKGYLHLKILPGGGREMVKRVCGLADRVSINIEAPPKFLPELCSQKDFKIDILKRLRWAFKFTKNTSTSLTTQFIVGAGEERDTDIMRMSSSLYRKFSLKRIFFSSFVPLKKTPLESRKRENPMREMRLYQSDFLMREYGFDFKRFVFEENGNLDMNIDPKIKIAMQNRDEFPVDVEKCNYDELIKVPGIGPVSAKRIVEARETCRIDSNFLKKQGVALKRAIPFIRLQNGVQKSIFDFKN